MNKTKIGLIVGGVAVAGKAMAFDSASFVTEMSTGTTSASDVATGIAGLAVGVLVIRKIMKYFNKAG